MPLPLLIGLGVAAAAAVAAVAITTSDDSSSSQHNADEQTKRKIEEENEKKRQQALNVQQQDLNKQKLNKRKLFFDTEFNRLSAKYDFDNKEKSSIQTLLISKENMRLLKARIDEHWPKTAVSKGLSKTIRDLDLESKTIEMHIKSLKEQTHG